MIKQKSRSEGAFARRVKLYRQRRAEASCPADHVYAAFELYRGHVKHVDDGHVLAEKFVAFVENAVTATTKGR